VKFVVHFKGGASCKSLGTSAIDPLHLKPAMPLSCLSL
jgi:hypothetical protein